MPKKRILLVAFIIFTGISLTVTFPILLHINSRVIGAPRSDIHPHLWDFWWVKTALLEDGVFPLRTDLINFPKGGILFPVSLLNAVISVPFQLLWGLEAAINIIVIFNLTLGCLGAFCLAHYLVGDIKSSFIAGLIYGFSPFLLSFGIASGGLEIISIGWLPLFFLFFIRTLREKGLKNPILASIFAFFIVISCLYYTILAMFFVSILLIYFLIIVKNKREDSALFTSRSQQFGLKKVDKHLVKRMLILVLVTLLLNLPVVISVYHSIVSPDSILPHEMFRRRLEGECLSDFSPTRPAHAHCIVFLEDYFLSGEDKLAVSHEVTDFYQSSYCGYTVLFSSIIALLFVRKKFTYFWFTAALFFVMLSLGPYLAISRRCFLPKAISPIYLILYYLIPPFKAAFVINRFVVLVMLCLSVLAAAGSKFIIEHLHKPYGLLFTLGTSGLILFEFLFVSPIQFPIPETALKIPEFYQELADENGKFGILELPFFIHSTNIYPRERFIYQITHRKPITDIVAGFLPEYIAKNPFTKKLVLLERPNYRFLISSADVNLRGIRKGFKRLARDNFRYIIVNKNYYQPDVWLKVKILLEEFMGKAKVYPDGIEVFRIK